MGQWIELELRKEQFDLIVGCLEEKCCKIDDYLEIERLVHLIENLQKQEDDYNQKLLGMSDIKF